MSTQIPRLKANYCTTHQRDPATVQDAEVVQAFATFIAQNNNKPLWTISDIAKYLGKDKKVIVKATQELNLTPFIEMGSKAQFTPFDVVLIYERVAEIQSI